MFPSRRIVTSGGASSFRDDHSLAFDGSNDYILKGTTIPLGATLRLDSEDLNFDLNRYSLFILWWSRWEEYMLSKYAILQLLGNPANTYINMC